MKNSKFLSFVLTATFAMGALAACNITQHTCQHVCEICGTCYDASCKDQACSNKCQGHTLSAPTITLNNNVVSWTAVEHAKGYDVYVNNSLKTTVTATSYTINETLVGSYEVKVSSKGNGAQIASSGKSNAVTYRIDPIKIGTPVLTKNGNVVSWTAIANAGSYDVFVNDVKKGNQTALSYTFAETVVGSYEVKVMAKAGSTQFADSDKSAAVTYTVDPTKLATPSLTLTGNVVTWSEVANAASYEVFVNDTTKGTQTELSYTITETTVGTYEVKVVAKTGSTQYVDSDKSAGVTYTVVATKLATPSLTLTGNVVTWAEVANAASYEVFVNDTTKGTQTGLSYTITETALGSYEVKVTAKSGSAQYIDSDKSTGVTYTISPIKLDTPVISLSNKTVSWSAIDNATGYEVYDGSTKLADVTTTSYKINGVSLGDHSITVKAVTTDPYFTASDLSTASTYTAKLDETPVILSIQACGDIIYDPQLGCLRQAVATDTEADKAVQFFPIEGQDGYYNIKTSSGLYLWTPNECQYCQWYRTLARPDLPDDYVKPLAAWKLFDISPNPSNTYFHLYNKGLYDNVNQLEVGLAGSPSNNLINVWTYVLDVWTTILVRTADATIAETPAPLVSGADFSKKSIAYFFGSEDTYAYDTVNNYYIAGKDVSTMTAQEKEDASWTFEDAGNGRYYIKTADGCYMKGYINGTTCYLTKVSAETTKDAYFEFYFMPRGGHFYSMSNVGLENEAYNLLYAWNTALMTFNVRWQQSCAFIIYIDSIA